MSGLLSGISQFSNYLLWRRIPSPPRNRSSRRSVRSRAGFLYWINAYDVPNCNGTPRVRFPGHPSRNRGAVSPRLSHYFFLAWRQITGYRLIMQGIVKVESQAAAIARSLYATGNGADGYGRQRSQ